MIQAQRLSTILICTSAIRSLLKAICASNNSSDVIPSLEMVAIMQLTNIEQTYKDNPAVISLGYF